MTKFPLFLAFFLAFFAFLFWTLFFPNLRLFCFAPFLALTFQRKSLQTSLWIAAFCGLFLDLLGSATHFGFFSLVTALCTLFCYRFRHAFFEDRLFSVPLYTALISSVFSLLHLFLFPSLLSIKGILGSVLILPVLDALYAFLWFTCPMVLYHLFFRSAAR